MQALHNIDKDLAFVKAQLLKQYIENKDLVVKGVKAERTIKKV
jgi:hypothetical protein